MNGENNWVIYDGVLVPAERPVVPVVSRGLMYGDGVFETFKTYNGQTFLFGEHIDRLYSGIEILGFTATSELELASLKKSVYTLLKKNKLETTDAIVRVQVWRGGGRGYNPSKNSDTHFSVTASACPDSFPHPKLKTVEIRRIPSRSLPSEVKLTNGINYILAAKEARQNGADEALMLTIDGFVSETTIANLFWVKGNTICTPGEECDLIPGITRKVLGDIIEKNDRWNLQKGNFLKDDILDADAVWMTNSVRELLSVKQIDKNVFDIDSFAVKELQQDFTAFRKANLKPLIE